MPREWIGKMPVSSSQVTRLREAVAKSELSYAVAKRMAEQSGRAAPTVRHKCFITYHGDDIDQVTTFVEDFNDVFIPRVVGASDSDHFKDPINSQDEDYIKDQIGGKYLSDSAVTILFVGRCTWARKFVDWELASSLRDGSVNKLNGLMGITPSDRSQHTLPARFNDNLTDPNKYARYYYYPTSATELRNNIEDAYQARTLRKSLRKNSRSLRTFNASC